MAWEDDPYQQSAYVNYDHAFNDHPVNLPYREDHIDPRASCRTLPGDLFFRTTGIWPFDGRPAPRFLGRPCMLRDIAGAKEDPVVRPRQELVDGRWCHVLEWPRNESLWVDTERGFVLLAARCSSASGARWASGLSWGGTARSRPVLAAQLDPQPPTGLRGTDQEGRRRRLIDARHEILRADVGPVDDRTFVFRPRPGSLKMTGVEAIQAHPGGLDHLDDVALGPGASPVSRPPARPAIPISAVAFVPAILYIVACEVHRRRAARPPVAMEHPL